MTEDSEDWKIKTEEDFEMLKKFLVTLILAVSFFAVGGQSNQAEAYWGLVVNCREWITLRSYPSTSAESLAQIPLGEWVWIDRGYNRNGFLSAEYAGMHGYVLAAYIKYIKD